MMDSWSYVSEEKGLAFGEANSSPDSYSRNKNALNPSYYDNNIQCLSENHHQGLGELGFPKLIRNSIEDVLFYKDGDELSSKHSSSIVESNTRDSFSSLIDLKLGRFVDHRSVNKNFKSSAESSTPVKRFRSTSMNARTFFCQVHGCNKDLSGSKDYHKKHRVCEAHSKTAKVTVNGIEQRFCQQCSRFHLLDEFDDGKRSCRKRLAGHNERRRKPQMGIRSCRNERLPQSYNGLAGSMLSDPTVTDGSFIYPYVLPNGLLHPEEHDMNDWRKRIKLEDRMDVGPPLASPITNKNFHSKPNYPHFHEDHALSIFSENSSRLPHEPTRLNYGSRSLIQDSSFGNEDLADFDTALSTTGCALSLLSSELRDMDQAHGHYSNTKRVCEDLTGVSSQASFNGISNKFRSSRMNSEEGNNLNPMLVSDGCNDSASFDITDKTFKGSEIVNFKDSLFCEDSPSPTIDLLQLSSQLQRVERQRQYTQGTPGKDAFCCFTDHVRG